MNKIIILIVVLIIGVGVGVFIFKVAPSTRIEPNTSINLNEVYTLNLSSQNLTKIPDYVFNTLNLTELDVSNNKLEGAIQSQIGNLTKLKILRANNNLMTGVPAEIGRLTSLETLDLSNNQLTGLPNELANLKNLKTLNLSGNQNYSRQDLTKIKESFSSSTIVNAE
ncbi:MAG: leucine-rich repeat domain-containing protein [Candidatus Gribaldobacteria bacterium]|nr:leucine-rich repeat domain-containing protein [Candidatus Gribaldobacteria bacterium]